MPTPRGRSVPSWSTTTPSTASSAWLSTSTDRRLKCLGTTLPLKPQTDSRNSTPLASAASRNKEAMLSQVLAISAIVPFPSKPARIPWNATISAASSPASAEGAVERAISGAQAMPAQQQDGSAIPRRHRQQLLRHGRPVALFAGDQRRQRRQQALP